MKGERGAKTSTEYQRAGFRPVKQVQKRMLDPRLEGYAPMHVIPRLPELAGS